MSQSLSYGSGPLSGGISNILLLLALLAVGIVAVRQIGRAIGGPGAVPDVQSAPLMTNAERRVIRYIEDAIPHARIHAQVSMGAILQPARGLDRRTATITRNRFSSKRVDFLAEDRATGQIIAIIELDDWSHRRRNDRWRDRMTSRAGYRTIRLPSDERPTRESVRERIHSALYANTSTPTPTIGTTRRR